MSAYLSVRVHTRAHRDATADNMVLSGHEASGGGLSIFFAEGYEGGSILLRGKLSGNVARSTYGDAYGGGAFLSFIQGGVIRAVTVDTMANYTGLYRVEDASECGHPHMCVQHLHESSHHEQTTLPAANVVDGHSFISSGGGFYFDTTSGTQMAHSVMAFRGSSCGNVARSHYGDAEGGGASLIWSQMRNVTVTVDMDFAG